MKAGELLAELKRDQGARSDLTSSNVGRSDSPYAEALESSDTTYQDANRGQKIASNVGHDRGNQHVAISNVGNSQSPYTEALESSDTTYQDANRWQKSQPYRNQSLKKP